MGLEEQLPGGILLSTVEKVAGYVRKTPCGRQHSDWRAVRSR